MDWGKAKSILILIFLILNIFLAYNLAMERWSPKVSSAQIEAAESILNERGITLKTKIPQNSEDATRLAFEGVGQFDMNKVVSSLLGIDKTVNDGDGVLINGDKQISIENRYTFIYTNKSPLNGIDISNAKEIESNIRKFLKDAGLPTGDLELDSLDKQGDSAKVVFMQRKGRYKLFNNYVEVTVSNKGIEYMKCSLQKFSSTKKDEGILPAYKVLFQNLWDNKGMVISSIDLGYTIDETDGEITGHYERLHWRIKTEDGQFLYFDAVGNP